MHPVVTFVIRAVLGLAFAALILRIFRGRIAPDAVVFLAALLVGLAYVFEAVRRRSNRQGPP